MVHCKSKLPEGFLLSIHRWGKLVCVLPVLMVACNGLAATEPATPYPTEYLPTIIALTLGADAVAQAPASETPPEIASTPVQSAEPPDSPASLTATSTPEPTQTEIALESMVLVPPAPSSTALPDIPNALLEIRNLGPLSKVTSPLHLYAYVRTGADGRVLIELLGEDNRLLYRELKAINYVKAGGSTTLSTDLDFEIPSTAEVGRLRLSIVDEYNRTVAINSVPLILLSLGDSDIIPPVDLLAPIVIQQPMKNSLIQGGKVLVAGIARPAGLGVFMVKLIAKDGKEVGSRLVGVQTPEEGGYASFAIEVPYTISQPTPVLLVIQEGAQSMNDLINLTSLGIVVSP